ncbi:MAG: MFS transporter, partial [Actinomycetes bacterium]
FFRAVFATAPPEERGAASGTTSAFLDLGIASGPMLLGLAADAAGISAAFGLGAAFALAGAGWTLALHRRTRVAVQEAAA